MQKTPILLMACAVLFFMSGCATTSTNPREGGLLGGIQGLSSGAYEDRVKQREKELSAVKANEGKLKAENARLEATKLELTQKESKLRVKLASMEKDIAKLSDQVAALDFSKDDKNIRKTEVEWEIANVKSKYAQLRKEMSGDSRITFEQIEEKEKRINELSKQYAEVYKEVVTLVSVD